MTVTSDEWDAYKIAGYEMEYYNRQCQPNDKQGNGMIECRNGVCLVRLRKRLDQAGQPLSFWTDVCQYVSFLVNLIIDAKTNISPYVARHKEEFIGYIIAYGAFVWFLPNKTKPVKADVLKKIINSLKN
jgi:hypothetical protein